MNDKPTIEVRAKKRRATLESIVEEQERQARDLARIARLVEGDLVSRLAGVSRDLERIETELAKIVGMVGTIRAINNRADRTIAMLEEDRAARSEAGGEV